MTAYFFSTRRSVLGFCVLFRCEEMNILLLCNHLNTQYYFIRKKCTGVLLLYTYSMHMNKSTDAQAFFKRKPYYKRLSLFYFHIIFHLHNHKGVELVYFSEVAIKRETFLSSGMSISLTLFCGISEETGWMFCCVWSLWSSLLTEKRPRKTSKLHLLFLSPHIMFLPNNFSTLVCWIETTVLATKNIRRYLY